MSYLQALLVADARRLGRAQRSASVRHRHLTSRPLAILPWQLGAEPFTAAAVAWGFEPGEPKLVVPGEPRDRELAFRALTIVAREFNRWFEGLDRDEAPQIVVPNRGALALLGRLGRRLAYLPTTGDYPADPELVLFGRHLRFLFDRARFPGQQLVLVLTDLLSSHWVSELSDLETQSLPARLDESSFAGARLTGALLHRTGQKGADLTGADLRQSRGTDAERARAEDFVART